MKKFLQLFVIACRGVAVAIEDFTMQPVTTNNQSDRILRVRELCERAAMSRATIYRLTKIGKFPKLQKIGLYAVGLPESTFNAWLQSRAAA